MKIRKKKLRIKRKRSPAIDRASVFQFIKSAGIRGITAREIARKSGLADAIPVMRLLGPLVDSGKAFSQYVPARPGLAYAQESRYWLCMYKQAVQGREPAATKGKR